MSEGVAGKYSVIRIHSPEFVASAIDGDRQRETRIHGERDD